VARRGAAHGEGRKQVRVDEGARFGKRTPAGRWGEPPEIAGAAVFLASAAADYVTGHVLYVDGGFSAAY